MAARRVDNIDRLTDKQLAQLESIRDEWIEIGLSCEPVDLPKARRAVAMAYRSAKLDPPKQVVVCDGPISGAFTASILKSKSKLAPVWDSVGSSVRDSVRASVWYSVMASVRDSVRASVRDSVRVSVVASVMDSVRASVWDSVRASVWDSVRASVWDSVWDSVMASVRASVRDSVRASVMASVRDSVSHMVCGAHDAAWLSFYDAMWRFGLRDRVRPLRGLIQLAKSCGWWAPYRDVAILQHRHSILHRNSSGQLHRDGGMAVAYRDGWGFWALNGVRVPQWLAETPSEQIDPTAILKESNVEIRREIVRKVGVERIAYKLGATCISEVGDYALLDVPIGNGRHGRALKMLNPSVPECWHIEFVDPSCATVQQALNFRNGLTAEMIDDAHGANFYQQGDVLMFPRGATKFKSRPVLIT